MSAEQYKKEQNKVIWAVVGVAIAEVVLGILFFFLQMFFFGMISAVIWGGTHPGGTLYPLFLSIAGLAGL